MNERIKTIRKASRLNQVDFGDKIGITGGAVSMIEGGLREPSELVIRAICQKFGISRIWLETGEGDMIDPQVETDIQLLTRAMEGQSEAKKTILRAVALMPDDLLELFLQKLQQAQKKEP